MYISLKDQLLRKAFSYQNDLTAYAYAITRDWYMAQDAYQEALIAMNNKTDQIEDDELFKWLKRATKNKSIDMICKQESISRTTLKLVELVELKFDKKLNGEKQEMRQLQEKALSKCILKLRPEAKELNSPFLYRKNVLCSTFKSL
jgi:RNA polymerase sigma factor (sigma-70 family)